MKKSKSMSAFKDFNDISNDSNYDRFRRIDNKCNSDSNNTFTTDSNHRNDSVAIQPSEQPIHPYVSLIHTIF